MRADRLFTTITLALLLALFVVAVCLMPTTGCASLDKAARATTQATQPIQITAHAAADAGMPWAAWVGWIAGAVGGIAAAYLKVRNSSLTTAVGEIVPAVHDLLKKTPAPIADAWKAEQSEKQSPKTQEIVAKAAANGS